MRRRVIHDKRRAGRDSVFSFAPLHSLPELTPGQWWLGEERETPPPAVLRTAREELLLAQTGTLAGQPAVSRMGDAWRVEWTVTDPAGISWLVSPWIGPDGVAIPAGG